MRPGDRGDRRADGLEARFVPAHPPHVAPNAVVATNTSGLSIEAMAEALPQAMRSRFCGIHFFNPPRYMQLLELIPLKGTQYGTGEGHALLGDTVSNLAGRKLNRARFAAPAVPGCADR